MTASLSFNAGLIRQAEDLEGLLAEPIASSLPPAILQPFRRANNRYVRRRWPPSRSAVTRRAISSGGERLGSKTSPSLLFQIPPP